MREQHLDPFNIINGILIPLFGNVGSERNLGYAAALATAHNDWQVAEWLDRNHACAVRLSFRRTIPLLR